MRGEENKIKFKLGWIDGEASGRWGIVAIVTIVLLICLTQAF